jgi:hypothetical protein
MITYVTGLWLQNANGHKNKTYYFSYIRYLLKTLINQNVCFFYDKDEIYDYVVSIKNNINIIFF